MAFKMKNPSVAKMVKMAGNNRTAMKMKAEEAAAMKMKKAAMKLKEEAAMKMKGRSLTSDSAHGEGGTGKKEYTQQDRRTARAKKQSAMKANKPDFPDIDGDGNTSESMKQAAADKKSGMKLKTFERESSDFTQSEKDRKRDRGEGRKNPKQDRRNFYNEKKTRRKVEKSRKADAKARTAMAEFDAKAPKTKAAQDAMSKKDARKVGKLGKKAAKAEQKARVKEAVASRQLAKQGSDDNRPEVKTRMGKGLDVDVKLPGRSNVAKGQRKFGTKTADNKGRRKGRLDKGGVSVKVVDKERRDNTATRQARKAYRQKTGVRGAINVRRKAKGKDVI